jgi:serine protease Do
VGVALAAGSIGPEFFVHGGLFPTAAAQPPGSTSGAGDVADLVDKVKPAVVGVRTRVTLETDDLDRLFGVPKDKGAPTDKSNTSPRPRVGSNQGSGFFISPDGYIVTTSHLVEGGQKIEITTDEDKTYPARLIGSDARTDLALLKVDAERHFPSVPLAQNAPRIGEWVLAVGNPFGLGGTVTAGIVSARARDIKVGTFNDFIQIDAPVNQGNSGGPTFDLKGNVIGVNSAIFSPTGGSVGIGFAIPADTVGGVIAQLKERGAVIRGWLGVQIQPLTSQLAEGLGVKEATGAVVVEPQSNGPAAQAGVAPGDVITAVNGEAVKDDRDLVKRIGDLAPGTSVNLDVSRKGDRKTIGVTLAEMPGGPDVVPSSSPTQQSGPTRTARPDPSNLGLEFAPNRKLGDGGGVIVTDVDPNGLGADQGLQTGDIILEIESKMMKTSADVHKVLAETRQQGKHVAIARVKSGDSMRFVAIPVG